jgi:hypothetical protein
MRSPGPLARYLVAEHEQLRAHLARADATPGRVDRDAYDAFRRGLLRHIAIEEKVLFAAAREARGGARLPDAARLRIDHGAIAALLVPPPASALVAELRKILDPHEVLEEEPGGVYAQCEELLGERTAELLARMQAYPPVKAAAHFDGARVLRTADEALAFMRAQVVRADPEDAA